MKFTIVQDYPSGLDRLWSAFGQPEYPLRKYSALGAQAVRLRRFDATPLRIEVDLERVARLFAAQVQQALNEDHAYTLRYLEQASAADAAPVPGSTGHPA